MRKLAVPAALAAATLSAPSAAAQEIAPVAVDGTQLVVSATGEVRRVPDIARISAGVVTQAATASDAIRQNSRQMEAVIAALRRAGIPEGDIRTSAINLHPEYRYRENQPPQLTGYRASNEVTVTFRDLQRAGAILDALVAQGANQISGPMLALDDPEEAMNEARLEALSEARARAELYARSLGMRVERILLVSETGGGYAPPPPPRPMMMRAEAAQADVPIEPGEQEVTANLTVTFELE